MRSLFSVMALLLLLGSPGAAADSAQSRFASAEDHKRFFDDVKPAVAEATRSIGRLLELLESSDDREVFIRETKNLIPAGLSSAQEKLRQVPANGSWQRELKENRIQAYEKIKEQSRLYAAYAETQDQKHAAALELVDKEISRLEDIQDSLLAESNNRAQRTVAGIAGKSLKTCLSMARIAVEMYRLETDKVPPDLNTALEFSGGAPTSCKMVPMKVRSVGDGYVIEGEYQGMSATLNDKNEFGK
jgi:hypothetical protein